jgi:magnesium chelatase family protein
MFGSFPVPSTYSVSRRATPWESLGPAATPEDLPLFERCVSAEVDADPRLLSHDHDAWHDVFVVQAADDDVAEQIVDELLDRAWNRFCANDVPPVEPPVEPPVYPFDLADIRGDADAWAPVLEAVVECLVTRRPLMLIGSYGSGRVMLARRLVTLLPGLTDAEVREVTRMYVAALLVDGNDAEVTRRPYRCPHHTVSCRGMAGGGSPWRPGEVDLAAHGVLHLDEVTHFSRNALEATRGVLRDITRPSPALLVLTDTPCSCGRPTTCACPPEVIDRHAQRVAEVAEHFGAVVVRVPEPVHFDAVPPLPSSSVMRQRVRQARALSRVQP